MVQISRCSGNELALRSSPKQGRTEKESKIDYNSFQDKNVLNSAGAARQKGFN